MSAILNPTASAEAKRHGQQLALELSGSWAEEVMSELAAWIAVQKARGIRDITVEQFRAQARHQPASHKAWGTLPARACRAGLITPKWAAPGVQARVKAAAPRTHSHEIKVWSVT